MKGPLAFSMVMPPRNPTTQLSTAVDSCVANESWDGNARPRKTPRPWTVALPTGLEFNVKLAGSTTAEGRSVTGQLVAWSVIWETMR